MRVSSELLGGANRAEIDAGFTLRLRRNPLCKALSERWDECCGALSGANGTLSNIFSAINRTYIQNKVQHPLSEVQGSGATLSTANTVKRQFYR
jgi:hypothetical protein